MPTHFSRRLCLTLVLAAFASPVLAADGKPNIIFVMADDLGYGDLGSYGQTKIRTPHLDRMAAEGIRFTQAYAGSTVCAPSRSCLMTGQHTGHTLVRGNAKVNLRPEDVTIAEVLKRAGYATALIGKWGLGHEGSTGVPTKQGFDYFFGYLDQHHAHNYYPSFLLRNEQRVMMRNIVPKEDQYGGGVATKKIDYSHDLIADEALKWIDDQKDGPFFLYLALTIPHANNEAGPKGMEVPEYGDYSALDWPEAQKGHAAMISRMDRDMGRLFDRLKQLGIDDKTIVFFTSDNGPHREGGNDPDFADSSGPLRGIKRDLYEGGIRVPMIVRWPGRIKPGVSDHVWANWDFMPTAAELAGAPDHLPQGIDGLSVAPVFFEQQAKQHEFLYWEFHERGTTRAVRMGDWKLIEKGGRGGPVELYDLSKDVAEQHNLAAHHADIVAKMLALMNASRSESEHWKLRDYQPKEAK